MGQLVGKSRPSSPDPLTMTEKRLEVVLPQHDYPVLGVVPAFMRTHSVDAGRANGDPQRFSLEE